MGVEAAVIGAVASLVGAGYGVYSGERASNAQKSAQSQAREQAEKQAKAAEEALNQANQKTPDTSAILSAARQSGKSGQSGTMLTGAQGIDPSTLTLGKSTLLGQ